MNSKPIPRIRVFIVEDQGMIRSFFERWLAGLPRFVLVGSAGSGEEAFLNVEAARPDVALVDFQLPGMDGIQFIHAARQLHPRLRALVVSSLVDPLVFTRISESGVEGFVEKTASPEMLAEAFEAVADGRAYFSETLRAILAREGAKAESVGKILSRREQQVLGFVLDKKANREIAELMNLSVRMVEFHRANLMAKLEASNVEELRSAARRRGWTGKSSSGFDDSG